MNSTVSHEMRNPLNAIISQTAALSDLQDSLKEATNALQEASQRQTFSTIIERSCKSIQILMSSSKLIRFNVEDILALPQLKQGKFSKNVTKVNIQASVQEIVDIMDMQAKQKGIQVQTQFFGLP